MVVGIIVTVGFPSVRVAPPQFHWQVFYEDTMGTSRVMPVAAPSSTLETNLVTVRFAESSYKRTEILLLWTSGRQHVEVICAIPDIRLSWLGYERV